MMGVWLALVFFLALLVVGRGVFIALETAMRIADGEEEMDRWKKSDDPQAAEVYGLLKDERRPFFIALWEVGLLVGAMFLLVIGIYHLFPVSTGARSFIVNILALLMMVPVLIVFSEMIPQHLGRHHRDAILRDSSRLMNLLSVVFLPLVLALIWVSEALLRPLGIERAIARKSFRREDLQEIVEDDEFEGDHPDTARRDMISGIFHLHDTRVREVMRPLREVAAIRLPATQLMVCAVANMTGYSRFPVYQKNVVDLIGYVHILDILYAGRLDEPLNEFIRETYYVPETKRVDDLLQEFLDQGLSVAVAFDEHGGCSGWITREDILEEIVGDIDDEFDRESPQLRQLEQGLYLVPGAFDLDDLSDVLDIEIQHPRVDTIAGFIYDELGRVPEMGEAVRFKNLEFSVARMERYRIQYVEVRVLPENGSGS